MDFEIHVTRVDQGHESATLKLSCRTLRSCLDKVGTLMHWYLGNYEVYDYHLILEVKCRHSIIARVEL